MRSTILLVFAILFSSAKAADAAFTTEKCIAAKITSWGKLRGCQRSALAKIVQRKAADLAKCQTKFQEKLAKIDGKATKAAIACRFVDNGDGTITDADSGLMWEQKIETILNFPCAVINPPTCVTRTFTWPEAMSNFLAELNGFADEGETQSGHAGHSDWRMPNIAELTTILQDVPDCGSGGACIDPIFGPVAVALHWSSTATTGFPGPFLMADFDEGDIATVDPGLSFPARAVRNGL